MLLQEAQKAKYYKKAMCLVGTLYVCTANRKFERHTPHLGAVRRGRPLTCSLHMGHLTSLSSLLVMLVTL